MKNPLVRFVNFLLKMSRSMLQWFHRIPREQPHPSRDSNGAVMLSSPSRAHPSRDREGGGKTLRSPEPPAMPLTPEQFRTMFADMLADPQAKRLLLQSLVTCFPIQGGTCALLAKDVGAMSGQYFGSGTDCTQGDYYFPSNVGIGTTSPQTALSFGANHNVISMATSDGNDNDRLILSGGGGYNVARGANLALYGNESTGEGGTLELSAGEAGAIKLYTAGVLRAIINSAGNVGIGTASPLDILHVDGLIESAGKLVRFSGTRPAIALVDTDAGANLKGWQMLTSSGVFVMRSIEPQGTGPGFNLVVDNIFTAEHSSGRVGIGTSSPADKLHVKDGRIRSEATGDVRNFVLNQLSSSIKRTAISFQQQGSEQFVLGVDWNGQNRPDFFLADGAGVKRFILLKPLGGSNDDAPQIQAAIDLLEAGNPPGGIIYLSQGVYRIGSTIKIENNATLSRKGHGIKLRGYGAGQIGEHSPTHSPATRLLWTSTATNEPVIKLVGTEADTLQADEISDLAIDGAGVAGTGLHIEQVLHSHFHDVDIYNVKNSSGGIGMKVMGCSWDLFERCSIYNGYDGLMLGDPTANSHHNTFVQLNIEVITHYGIFLSDCDNNAFYSTHNTQFSGTDRGALVADLTVSGGDALARSNYFYHHSGGGPTSRVAAINVDTTFTYNKTLFFGYDRSNGEPQPEAYTSSTIIPGSALSDQKPYFFWTEPQGQMFGGTYN
jgi:hypothetical protein